MGKKAKGVKAHFFRDPLESSAYGENVGLIYWNQ